MSWLKQRYPMSLLDFWIYANRIEIGMPINSVDVLTVEGEDNVANGKNREPLCRDRIEILLLTAFVDY